MNRHPALHKPKAFRDLICVFLSAVFIVIFLGRADAQEIKDLFEQAATAFYEGQYDLAIKNYEKIIELQPNFAPAYNALGLALKVQGANTNDILFYFKKAIELDPSFLSSYDNLGKLYYSSGDIDQAEEYFKKGIALDPNNESMTLSMGWIYLLGRGDPDKAIAYFRKAATNNNSAMGYFGEGICLMSKQKRMEVVEIVTKLRGLSQEGLAQDLEVMLRENRSLLRQAEFPTAGNIRTVVNETLPQNENKPAASSQNVSSSSAAAASSFSEYDENGELRVRLLDKLPAD